MRPGASNSCRAAPNPNWDAQRECLRMAPRRAGSLKRLLVVAFAPRLRQKMRCTMRRELSSAFTATCIDTLGFEARTRARELLIVRVSSTKL